MSKFNHEDKEHSDSDKLGDDFETSTGCSDKKRGEGVGDRPKMPSQKHLYLTTIVFYALLVGLAFLLAAIWDIDPIIPYHLSPITTLSEILFALGTGLSIVAISKVLDKHVGAFRRLSNVFKDILGDVSIPGAFILAATSSIAEEIFFRGFLQQAFETVTFADCHSGPLIALLCASILFGLMHQGGDWKVYYPWTLFALVVGFILGGLYLLTGSLLAPIVVHFTVNFLNLSSICRDNTPSPNE